MSEWKTSGVSHRVAVVEKARGVMLARGRCDAARRERLDRSWDESVDGYFLEAPMSIPRSADAPAIATPATT